MNKKIVALATAALVIVASTVPVFAAASPTTNNVPFRPYTRPRVVNNQSSSDSSSSSSSSQSQPTATAQQAIAYAQGMTIVSASGTGIVSAVVQPSIIALALTDILQNSNVQSALAKAGVKGEIAKSGMLARANGTAGTETLEISADGIAVGQKVAILYYIPGDATPHVVVPAWKNGKLEVTLPLPCTYNIVK